MRSVFLKVGAGLMLVSPAMPAAPVAAQGYGETGFQGFLGQLRSRALSAGVSRETVERVFPTVSFNARVVELDRAQPGVIAGSNANPPFAPYRAQHVSAALIAGGRSRYQAYGSQLAEIRRRYGVPGSIVVAIWGHETSYGAVTGNFDLLSALATLAYEGRRRDLFADEFVAGLKMIDRGVPRSRLRGSWAGATGYPQFLPSVWLRAAVDWDGNGYSDIWQSAPDALASIANYFAKAGWRPGVPWGIAVNVPANLDRAALQSRVNAPRCPRVFARHSRWLSFAEWRRLGLVPQSGSWPRDSELATLIEPDGPGRTAYLTTVNYRVILDYNCSNFYALSVGLLADAIAR
jgi:membrane-bound lytic murein transglycosylase B